MPLLLALSEAARLSGWRMCRHELLACTPASSTQPPQQAHRTPLSLVLNLKMVFVSQRLCVHGKHVRKEPTACCNAGSQEHAEHSDSLHCLFMLILAVNVGV